ncbi:MAG TPA: c-type cytochrome [Usitatibacter sp.]|nr:c-type cytochrome [Usitatibacter sp.]
MFGAAIVTPQIPYAQTPDPAPPAIKVDLGKQEYNSRCAVCHGLTGKGDGPYKGLGSQTIPDLTVLAKNNGGVFPFQKTYEIIDGRTELKAHGTRDMPIWGTAYRLESREALFEVPYNPPEGYVRARILALNEYLYRIQQK